MEIVQLPLGGIGRARGVWICPEDIWDDCLDYALKCAACHDYSARETTSKQNQIEGNLMSKVGEWFVWLHLPGPKTDPPNMAVIKDPTKRRFGSDVGGHSVKTDYHTDSVVFNIGPKTYDIDPLSRGVGEPGQKVILVQGSKPRREFHVAGILEPTTIPSRLKPLRNGNPYKGALYFRDLTEEERNADLPLPRR